MKLSTKHSMTVLALCVISIIFAGRLLAENTTNTVPFSYDFEGLANDESIVGTNGWYAETNTYAIATNATYSYSGNYPLTTNHNTHIMLNTENGSLTNLVAHNGGTDPVIWLDTMIKATQSEDAPANITNDTAIQIAAYVSTNGELVIYHGARDGITGSPISNKFTTLSHPTIGTSDWVRLTIAASYANNEATGYGSFQVRLNGTALESPYGYDNPTDLDYANRPGSWHLMANSIDGSAVFNYMSAISLSGTGSFDDFVVTNALPTFSITWAIIASVNNALGASISPAGTNYYAQGSTQTVTITYSNFWDQTVTVDGSVTTPVPVSVTFENITSSHTVTVASVIQTLTNNVPTWWLATYGTNPAPDNAYALADDDGDGLSNWEEWLASTDPTVSNEFEIIKHYLTNGNAGVVVWVSAAVDPQLPPFNVLRTTNLMAAGGGWEIAGSTNRPIGGGTNEWIDPSPPAEGVPAYYRVSATN